MNKYPFKMSLSKDHGESFGVTQDRSVAGLCSPAKLRYDTQTMTMDVMTGFLQRRLIALLLLAVFSVVAQASDYMSPGLTPQQLLEKLDTDKTPLVVDVRKPAEFGVAHIPGAINIPLDEIEARLDEFKHNNGALIYCINGSRTRQVEAILLAADIPNVYHLEGTFSGWIQGKHPIEKGGVKKSGW
jgi:rhodanese-related sulfurtransferase